MSQFRPLVLLPTYNERENLPELTELISKTLPDSQILVVDDGSPDGSGDWAAKRHRLDPHLHLLQRGRKLGLGTAYRTGWDWGMSRGFDPIITMDADFSHHPKYLPDMLQRIHEGADLVIGSRYVQGGGVRNWPLQRRVLSRGANWLSRNLLRLPVKDVTAGFRGYRAHTLQGIDPDSIGAEGYSFLEESLWRVVRAGFRCAEIPIIFEDRVRGKSKIDRLEIFKGMTTLIKLRLSLPPKLVSGRRVEGGARH